jgi:hypothetical protein
MTESTFEQDEFSLVGGHDITFAWKESVNGVNQDIAIQKYSLAGAPLWGPSGQFVIQRDSTQSSPCLVKFPNQSYMVAWEDFMNMDADIYMRCLEADGDIDSYTGGVVISNELKIQRFPQIAVLNHEGPPYQAIIVWSDGVSSGKEPIYGLYAQKTGSTGIGDNQNPTPVHVASLEQNYPNPFNPETKINFSLAKNMKDVKLSIYNLKGQKVMTLHDGKTAKGKYSYSWNGKDDNKTDVATGVYFYKLSYGNKSITKKMILMK